MEKAETRNYFECDNCHRCIALITPLGEYAELPDDWVEVTAFVKSPHGKGQRIGIRSHYCDECRKGLLINLNLDKDL